MGSCWTGRSDENISYRSGTEAHCETQCRVKGEGAHSFGAIAYSMTEGAYGFSGRWSTREKAEQVALGSCREDGPGCEVTVWFARSCGVRPDLIRS